MLASSCQETAFHCEKQRSPTAAEEHFVHHENSRDKILYLPPAGLSHTCTEEIHRAAFLNTLQEPSRNIYRISVDSVRQQHQEVAAAQEGWRQEKWYRREKEAGRYQLRSNPCLLLSAPGKPGLTFFPLKQLKAEIT